MKLTKKILVAVLALALLASCFISSAFAVDDVQGNPFTAKGINEIDDILEYYSCNSYIAENYEKAEDAGYSDAGMYVATGVAGESIWEDKSFAKKDGSSIRNKIPVTTEVVEHPDGSGDKALHIDLGYADYAKYLKTSDTDSELPRKVYFTFDIYFVEGQNSYFEVEVKTEGNNALPLIKFDFKNTVLQYAPWEPTAKNFGQSVNYEGFTPEINKWYSVSVCYNADGIDNEEDGTTTKFCLFEVYDGDVKVVEKKYDAYGAGGIEQVACTAKSLGAMMDATAHAEMYIDDLEIYEGSFARFPSEKDEITSTTLRELETLFLANATSDADKLAVANVFSELLTMDDGKYETEILGIVAAAEEYVNRAYVAETINRIEKIDVSANYYDRCNHVNLAVAEYNDKLPTGVITELEGVSADDIAKFNSAREALAAELLMLETIKQHSEGFIAAIGEYDATSKNYYEIVADYTEASKDDYKLRSADYIGVVEAEAIYDELKVKHDDMVKDVDEFITFAKEMQENDDTFGSLYTKYVKAKTAYYKYDEMPEFANGAFINPDLDDSTHAELAEKKAYFEAEEGKIEQYIEDCNAFNMAVLLASSSDYYNTFVALLDAADALYAVIEADFEYLKDYPGLAEGKTIEDTYKLLGDLRTAANEKMTATDIYIAAVNAITAAEGFYAKREAVNYALSLKAAGDNLSVPGVKEANIALATAAAEINELQGNSEAVIKLVAELQAADSITERRQLVNEIAKFLGENNANVTEDFVGVTAAIANYVTEKAELAADIAAVNAAMTSAVKNAVNF